MTRFVSLLAALAVSAPALAIDANGTLGVYESSEMVIDASNAIEAIFEESGANPSEDGFFDVTVHWTSQYGIDWCMSLQFTTPDLTVQGGNITGTICGAGDWQAVSMSKVGSAYQVNYEYLGSGSCAETLCMEGTKVGMTLPNSTYGFWGSCSDFPADGVINGCQ